jgi:hypothetical protein
MTLHKCYQSYTAFVDPIICHSCAESIEYFMYMFLFIIAPNSLKILP